VRYTACPHVSQGGERGRSRHRGFAWQIQDEHGIRQLATQHADGWPDHPAPLGSCTGVDATQPAGRAVVSLDGSVDRRWLVAEARIAASSGRGAGTLIWAIFRMWSGPAQHTSRRVDVSMAP
jgi:hypothetical protein